MNDLEVLTDVFDRLGIDYFVNVGDNFTLLTINDDGSAAAEAGSEIDFQFDFGGNYKHFDLSCVDCRNRDLEAEK
ncbi:hypothetical protein KAR91_62970 [Candidatus Pacearchaeota archaeon]|nr:hypothetical protein [Candidatus Pacearchaeota archaeon]